MRNCRSSSTWPSSTRERQARHAAADAQTRRCQGGDQESAQAHQRAGCALGGQDHFYLEGQIALAVPGEDQDVTIYSSTQHPSEVQHMVSHALGVPSNAVTVEIRRMGGGFGGKETQGNQFAALAAIAAKKHRRAVKIRPDRDDDMIATGKRHDFVIDYEVGFDERGQHPRRRLHVRGALRLLGRPLRPGHRPRAVPLRQHLFLAGGACAVGAALHQHRVQHGVPRLRRAAGHGRGGARDRGGGLRRRQGPARNPQAEFLRHRRPQRHALSPDGRGQHHPSHRRRAGGELRTMRGGGARSRPSTTTAVT